MSCESTPIDGGVAFSCTYEACHAVGGRRPEGFDAIALSARDPVGEWLARAAALEMASVPAFRILATELRAHGAPKLLIDEARRAADQETQHARAMMRLAHRHDGTAMPFTIATRPVRTLETIAVENAVEGRVREAFGAVVAFEQARSAAAPEVRAAFAVIAPEEMGHARLAGAVDEWARGKLSRAGRHRVDEAHERARIQLARDLETETSETLRRVGLPDATRAQDLVADSEEHLLSDGYGGPSRRRRGRARAQRECIAADGGARRAAATAPFPDAGTGHHTRRVRWS